MVFYFRAFYRKLGGEATIVSLEFLLPQATASRYKGDRFISKHELQEYVSSRPGRTSKPLLVLRLSPQEIPRRNYVPTKRHHGRRVPHRTILSVHARQLKFHGPSLTLDECDASPMLTRLRINTGIHTQASGAIQNLVDSLIEELPRILERGKKEAQRVLDGLSAPNRIILQTNELVLPTKAKGGLSTFFGQPTKQLAKEGWLNRMIYGDNLLVMQALLAGDSSTGMPSLRDKVDLIYIDPPFDSKADYRTRVHLPSGDIEQRPAVIEQFAYSDTWKNGTAILGDDCSEISSNERAAF